MLWAGIGGSAAGAAAPGRCAGAADERGAPAATGLARPAAAPGDEREIGDLPACTVVKDGERELQPCVGHCLGEAFAESLLAAGLIPVMSHHHRNAVTVMRLLSVAAMAQPWAGLPGG